MSRTRRLHAWLLNATPLGLKTSLLACRPKAAVWVISALLCASVLQSAEVKTLSGHTHKGDVLSISEKEIRVKADGKETAVPVTDVLSVDFDVEQKPSATNPPHHLVKLMDGSLLRCESVALKGKNAELRLLNRASIQFPATHIQYVIFDAQDEKNRNELEQQLAKKPAGDVLLLLSRDGSSVNAFEGFVGDADAKGETVQFKLTGGDANAVAFKRVRGILYSRQADDKMPAAIARLHDTGQSVLSVKTIAPFRESYREGYKVTTPAGIQLDLSSSLVQRLDFSLGKVAYLSDLDAAQVEEAPVLADLWRHRRDRNLEGGPISLDRKTYTKGLAVHSRTVLAYDVQGYNWFRCVLGIDDLVTGPAHAAVRIEADGKELFSGAVTSKDKPRELNLALGGARRLRLVVDYGEDFDLGDHVDFADARVTK